MRFMGVPVHKRHPAPRSPGGWVDDFECSGCGELYAKFRGGMTFQEASDLAEVIYRDSPGGFYRSRGPILWIMRCNKLDKWYWRHCYCSEPHD